MPEKKPARAKKTPRGKKPMGLTSAIGPKATTMAVIIVMAGGIMVAARQQQTRAKEALAAEAARVEVALSPEPTPKTKASASTAPANASANAVVTPSTEVTAAAKAPPVTVTGCLERTDEGFRMKETSGADAPKSRSWKSGFLKKGSAAVDVVDSTRSLQLADHVGRRVSVTGTLVDREMRARSLRRVGACKAN